MKRYLYLIILLMGCSILTTQAQTTDERMRALYDKAEQDYNIGRLEDAEKQLRTNINDFPVTLLQSVYRMLSLCYLGMDREEDAQSYARLLLSENPYYSPTLNDPQRFIDMVDNLKSGLSATITTASSKAEGLSEVPVPTTLITEEMIRDCGARNLQEVLAAYVPGMYIIDCNDDINIAMRGIFSNGQEKILFMLNGHRLNSYCTNTAAPDFSISLEKLKQIEVLRGPASSLYGGVSLTAVVNLITKQGVEVDGIEAKVGAGSYGQYRGSMMFGKRYFDVDLLIWGAFTTIKGQNIYVDREATGTKVQGGDVTIGGIGKRPSYDFGASIKYRNLQFLYNTQFSQVQSPMTMTYTFSPYDIERYKTFYGSRPGHATLSHHANLNYGQQFGNVYLKGQVAYDNSDLTHYQVISDTPVPGLTDMLPLPQSSLALLTDTTGGLARYISGQEHTFGGKIQGEWSYINTKKHKGQLTFGAEYSYFQLDDARYVFVYDFIKTLPETINISDLGKGHEHNANSFVQLKHQWGPFILNAGLRFDYKLRYDSTHIREFSPRVALIFVQPKWNVKFSYAKAFIDAPYLYRKTNQFLLALMGAKGREQLALPLTPEAMHSYQLTFGATQWVKGLNFEVNAFYNRTRDMIYMDLIEHYNMGNSDIYGLELSADYETRRFAAHMSATWLHADKYDLIRESFDHAFNTPRFMAKGVLAWQATRQLRLHTHASFSGKTTTRYNDIVNYVTMVRAQSAWAEIEAIENPTDEQLAMAAEYLRLARQAQQNLYTEHDVAPYFIVNLGANYTIGKLQLGLNVNNLFNRKYSISGACTGLIPQKGRWLMFDIAYKF